MYCRIRLAVGIVQAAVPASHFAQTVPLSPAAVCRTVAGFTPRAAAYRRISSISCSIAMERRFLILLRQRFSIRLPLRWWRRKINL